MLCSTMAAAAAVITGAKQAALEVARRHAEGNKAGSAKICLASASIIPAAPSLWLGLISNCINAAAEKDGARTL